MSERVLSKGQVEQFVRDGYVCVEGAIDPDTVERGIGEFKEKTGIVAEDPETWPQGEKYVNMNVRWKGETLHTQLSKMDHTICVTPRLVAAARELAGPDVGLQRMSPAIAIPEAGAKQHEPRGIHIDKVVAGITMYPSCEHLTALGYLTDTTEYGGALSVFPGSHRKVFEYAYSQSTDLAEELRSKEGRGIPDLDYGDPVPATGKAGDVVLFHHLLAHSASANRGEWVRIGLRGEVKLPSNLKYEPKLGLPQYDWLPIDWTLRTDNLLSEIAG